MPEITPVVLLKVIPESTGTGEMEKKSVSPPLLMGSGVVNATPNPAEIRLTLIVMLGGGGRITCIIV